MPSLLFSGCCLVVSAAYVPSLLCHGGLLRRRVFAEWLSFRSSCRGPLRLCLSLVLICPSVRLYRLLTACRSFRPLRRPFYCLILLAVPFSSVVSSVVLCLSSLLSFSSGLCTVCAVESAVALFFSLRSSLFLLLSVLPLFLLPFVFPLSSLSLPLPPSLLFFLGGGGGGKRKKRKKSFLVPRAFLPFGGFPLFRLVP